MLESTALLIKKIYKEIESFDPDLLQRYRSKDDQQTNIGELAGGLVGGFPMPIGIELQRLFSDKVPGTEHLQHIFRIFEKTVQFISFIMLCQVVDEKLKKNLQIPESFSGEFTKRFTKLSMGDFVWLIKSLANIFKKENREWFMPEMNKNFNAKFFEDLNYMVVQRNEDAHLHASPSDFIEDHLTEILVRLAFLVRYKLVYVREITVLKSKYRDANFHHNMDLLNIALVDMPEEFDVPKMHTDTNSVLLMKSIYSIEDFLNLSPLIIDADPKSFNDSTIPGIPNDIYMYSKYQNGHLTYNGTKSSGICTSNSKHYSKLLEEEFNEIITLLS